MEIKKEFSAGGIVLENGKVLLIMMRNLAGKKVWTFPKGHIEEGESRQEAALREVLEETGIRCEITGEKEFYTAAYSFIRNDFPVEKKVFWYLMKPVKKTGKILTPEEIFGLGWSDYAAAQKKLEYQSDLGILELIRNLLTHKPKNCN